MFVIQDGRETFYQWDINRKLLVKDKTIKEVHFCNKTEECSLVCVTYEENGETLVDVPNILLTTDWKIKVFGYTGDYTKYEACFKVVPRSKPEDYAYTETEVRTFEMLQDQINALPKEEDISELISIELNHNGYITYGDLGSYIDEHNFTTEDRVNEIIENNENEFTKEQDVINILETNKYANTVYVDNAATNAMERAVKEGKAVIVTVNGTVPSATSQQIYNYMSEGKVVYLYLWDNTYTICSACTKDEAKFENSYFSTVTSANGDSHNLQRFRVFFIKNNRYSVQNVDVPTIGYIDAQIQYYLNN